MKVTITPRAKEELTKRKPDGEVLLKLHYDTEGCGCVVSGIPTLRYIPSEQKEIDDHITLATNDGDIIVERTKLVFYDDEVVIDYSETARTFQLKNDSQILNPRMALRV